MTDFWSYFSHGAEYTENNVQPEEKPRSKSCESCAFTSCKNTVRPSDISLSQMIAKGDQFDIFYCHNNDIDGKTKICATWYKLFGDLCLPRYRQNETEINKILNSDVS